MTIQGFIFGLLMSAAGFLILRFRFKVRQMFPRHNWFERKLGPGSTYPVIILGSLLLVVLGLMTSFGFIGDFFKLIFGPIIGAFDTST